MTKEQRVQNDDGAEGYDPSSWLLMLANRHYFLPPASSKPQKMTQPSFLWIIHLLLVLSTLILLHRNHVMVYSYIDVSEYNNNDPLSANEASTTSEAAAIIPFIHPTTLKHLKKSTDRFSTNTTSHISPTMTQRKKSSEENVQGDRSFQHLKRQSLEQNILKHLNYHNNSGRLTRNTKSEVLGNMISTKQPHRCYVVHPGYPTANDCYCAEDPNRPTDKKDKLWVHHHKDMVQHAIQAKHDLDLVMIGDSIIERWNGTRHLGSIQEPGMRHVTKKTGGSLEAIALGSAGDTSQNLLWHLHNGLLPSSFSKERQLDNTSNSTAVAQLNPKIWLILIGTNDLFINGCSEDSVFAGIVNVVNLLQKERPNAQIVIHGILPRLENRNTQYRLGPNWDRTQSINDRLVAMIQQQGQNSGSNSLHYMEASHLFLKTIPDGSTDLSSSSPSKILNQALMDDGVHPTVQGLEVWGDYIVQYITKLLKKQKQLTQQ